jgi:hypothetical protein
MRIAELLQAHTSQRLIHILAKELQFCIRTSAKLLFLNFS